MFKSNRCADSDMNMNMGMGSVYGAGVMPDLGSECAPIYECPCERECHREICHNVEHIQPIHTRIINHHIYHHHYVPCYTCCEENVVSNVYDQNPCGR
jgi:hypothetical protein